jgi:ketosteroid isomerase-like protein
MSEQTNRAAAYDPQDLERLLVSRENAGDFDGMAALYDPQAVLDASEGQLLQGREAIRKFFRELVATGRKFEMGEQQAARVSGDFSAHFNALPQWHRDRRSCPSPNGRDVALGHR